ncbi:MAG: hypothetical protein ACLFQ9_09215 [Desulfobacterales bacterium]
MANQDQDAAPEEQAGHFQETGQSAEDIVVEAEAGPRHPVSRIASAIITMLCVCWSGYQLYIAYQPINSHIARA